MLFDYILILNLPTILHPLSSKIENHNIPFSWQTPFSHFRLIKTSHKIVHDFFKQKCEAQNVIDSKFN